MLKYEYTVVREFYKGISIVSWNVLSLQALNVWKLSGGKAHYDYDYCYNLHFFVLCDVSSAVENYFQKVFSLPTEKPTLPFLLTPSPPPKNWKSECN